MKTPARATGTLLFILLGSLMSGTAMADYRAHDYGHGNSHGATVRFGFSYGFPVFAPRYFPAPYYAFPAYAVPAPYYAFPAYAVPAPVYAYPPTVVRYSSPTIYVERSAAPAESAPSQAQGDWYYCAGSKSYYPYVRECPGGWQRVPAQPASR